MRGTTQLKEPSQLDKGRTTEAIRTKIDDALFNMKIAPPRRSVDLIPRSHFIRLIQQSRAKLIVARAPAGFGKTTLLQQWSDELTSDQRACAWLTLDAGDNDPARFLAALSASIQNSGRNVADEVDRAGLAGARASRLVAALQCSSRPLVVMLDDVHVLQTKAAQSIVRILLQSTPDNIRMVIAGRSIPSFGQARLRLTDSVVDIGIEDLRFRNDETSAFLSRRLPGELSRDQLNQIHIYTEGWPAALQLASLSMRSRDKTRPFFVGPHGMDVGMVEYLKENVFDRQGLEIQDFFLQTCVLEQLSGGICNALTGREDSDLILERLNNDGFLLHLVEDSEGRTWYRFHKLFAEFLKQEAYARSPNRYSEAHRAAAGWFERHGIIATAAVHAQMGGDREAALALLDGIAMEHVWRGRLRTVLSWSTDLTIEHAARYERLFIAYLWAEGFVGNVDRAMRRLDELAELNRGRKDISGFLTNSLICLPTVFAAARHDFQAMENTGLNALANLSGGNSFEHGATANCVVGNAIAWGRIRVAREALAVARAACHVGQWTYNAAYTYLAEGHLHLYSLRLDLARASVQNGYDWLTEHHSEFSQSTAIAASCLAEIYYEFGDRKTSQTLIDRHLPMMAEAMPECMLSGYGVAARLAVDRQDFERANELVNDMRAHGTHRNASVVVRSARSMQAWLSALQGRRELAISQMNDVCSIEGTLDEVASSAESVVRNLYSIRTALTLGLAGDVLGKIDQLMVAAIDRNSRRRALYLRVLKARALALTGDRNAALAEMKIAFYEAIHCCCYACLINEGDVVSGLVSEVRGLDAGKDATNKRDAFDQFASKHNTVKSFSQLKNNGNKSPEILSYITKRELDILNAVQRGLTNSEIGDCFSLSTTTVKWHMRNIFSKLGVGNRTEAAFIFGNCSSDPST